MQQCIQLILRSHVKVQVRERDWCNVITAHQGDPCAYTWLLKNYTLGAPPPPPAC